MDINTKEIQYETKSDIDIINITEDIQDLVTKSKVKDGQVTVFIPGSTASLTTVEYETGLVKDLKALFERVAPKNIRYAHDEAWHDGNGHSHIRASLLGPSLTIPFSDGRLILGTWQQVILLDFDNRPRKRRVVVQVIGNR